MNNSSVDGIDDVKGDEDNDGVDEGNEGLPRKFRNSAFVRALREAIENGLTTRENSLI